MSKQRFNYGPNPFLSPRASVKHASRQVNGETEPGQQNEILAINTKART
ncbi:YpzG family protein [Bacillaceae bacterium SIJ1]|nr:YpzG family protein [Litoribacterium kuwaitense]NGP46569.1 YpzG family protein [Litoribacterium kuwaitense]